MQTNLYLVVEAVTPIAEDLALTIAEADDHARVLLASDPEAALPLVRAAEPAALRLALVHCDPAGLAGTALRGWLAERGVLVVYMGDRAEEGRHTVPVLVRPFTQDAVADLVAVGDRCMEKAPGGVPGA
ncbi:MAG TPA: hypothetical protein PKD10_05095 [Paracoccaceae bacterium]|nr:hypothetical protein [Paracoccaceae bacterium]